MLNNLSIVELLRLHRTTCTFHNNTHTRRVLMIPFLWDMMLRHWVRGM